MAAGACLACAARQQRAHSGRYLLTCLPCCAALVRSARPVRALQDGMLACIARQPGAPQRADVLAAVKGGRVCRR